MRNPYPILWFDVDNRLKEMAAAKGHIESGRVIPWTINVPLIEDSIRARQLSTESRGKLQTIGPPKKQPQGYPLILDMMDKADKFIVENGIRTIVFDPITRVVEHMMRYLAYQTKHGVIEESAWGIYLSNLEEFVAAAMSFPGDVNVIMILHSRDFFDEDTGRNTAITPLLSGQMRAKVGSYFSEVWYNHISFANGRPDFKVQCQPSNIVMCRTSRGLDFVEPASMQHIMKKGNWDERFTLMLYGPFGSGKSTLALDLCNINVEEEKK